jgi:hypothetical protein
MVNPETPIAIEAIPVIADAELDAEKAEIEQNDLKPRHGDDEVVMKSPFEDFDFFKTLRIFKYATFMALLAAFSASAEYGSSNSTWTLLTFYSGYQVCYGVNCLGNANC